MIDHEKPVRSETPTLHVSTRPDSTMTVHDWLAAAVMGLVIASAVLAMVAIGHYGSPTPTSAWSALGSL